MIRVNVETLLIKNKRTKYWLCQRMNITSRNLNRLIRGDTKSISFRYIEELCEHLKCEPGELFTKTSTEQKDCESQETTSLPP